MRRPEQLCAPERFSLYLQPPARRQPRCAADAVFLCSAGAQTETGRAAAATRHTRIRAATYIEFLIREIYAERKLLCLSCGQNGDRCFSLKQLIARPQQLTRASCWATTSDMMPCLNARINSLSTALELPGSSQSHTGATSQVQARPPWR